MSHYLVITTKSPRLARDTLRRVMWAVWIWSQQTHPDSIGSRFQSIVESLPRHLLEYEKPLIRTLVYAFGFDKIQSASESAKMNETFLKVYIRTFSAMKPFFSCNPKAMGICSSSSTNLFLAASPCIVPVEEIDKILARVFSVSLPEGILCSLSSELYSLIQTPRLTFCRST